MHEWCACKSAQGVAGSAHHASGSDSCVPRSLSVHCWQTWLMAKMAPLLSCSGVRMRSRELCTILVCFAGHPAVATRPSTPSSQDCRMDCSDLFCHILHGGHDIISNSRIPLIGTYCAVRGLAQLARRSGTLVRRRAGVAQGVPCLGRRRGSGT